MKLRHAELDAFCDDALEPTATLFRRARAKGLLRRLHETSRLGDGAAWRRRLSLTAAAASRLAGEGAAVPFAQLWAKIEAASPVLHPIELLRPSGLPAEIARLERVLRWISVERTRTRTERRTMELS